MSIRLFALVILAINCLQYTIRADDGELQQIVKQFRESSLPIEPVIPLTAHYSGNIASKVFVEVAPKILRKVSKDVPWFLELTHVRLEGSDLLLCNESKPQIVLRETAHYCEIIPSVDELGSAKANVDIERLIGKCDFKSSFSSTSNETSIENLTCRWIKWSVQKNGDVSYLLVKTITDKENPGFKAFSVQSGFLKPREIKR